MSETAVVDVIRHQGPMTGSQLFEASRMGVLSLWRQCRSSPSLHQERAGRRYLRLDRAVEGYARLSPSIRREFLTYTVWGLQYQTEAIRIRAAERQREIAAISLEKINLAREIAVAVLAGNELSGLAERACFLIAGDVVYNMAHRVPRPEKSTGEMVRGSDLDIVIITAAGVTEAQREALDHAIYEKKHFFLVHPDYREEVDYLIKSLDRVREQMAFDTFENMVACKIMDESRLLYGSRTLFQQVKGLLAARGIPGRIADLESRAAAEREKAEADLLGQGISSTASEHLFYTQEEGEEIY